MFLLFLYLLLALLVSFLCSVMEAVLLTTPMTYLKTRAEHGDKSAPKLIKLKNDVDKPLSAILSLNTIAHTVGAAGVGAQATVVFGEAYLGLVSAILTILILVFSEIIPKTIGTNYYKSLISISAKIIMAMVIIAYPLVIISGFLTKLMSKKGEENTTSREEISTLANIGVEEGIIKENENRILQNLIKLCDIRVSKVMTPRPVVTVANENMTLTEFMADKTYLIFSRIPVYNRNSDNITGYVLTNTILEKMANDQFNFTLGEIKREIVVLPETSTVFYAWEKLLESKEHIALVLNEYGEMAGIITMEDIIETLLGLEIVDEKDTIVDMQQYALEKWQTRQKSSKGGDDLI